MADILTRQERSARMASIRQSGTRPEIEFRHELHALGLRYRVNVRSLPGTPDLAFARYRAVVFINGCFWHGHSCAAGRAPATNQGYWLPKLQANRARDRRKARQARALGWRVFVVWECSIKSRANLGRAAAKLAARIRQAECAD